MLGHNYVFLCRRSLSVYTAASTGGAVNTYINKHLDLITAVGNQLLHLHILLMNGKQRDLKSEVTALHTDCCCCYSFIPFITLTPGIYRLAPNKISLYLYSVCLSPSIHPTTFLCSSSLKQNISKNLLHFNIL